MTPLDLVGTYEIAARLGVTRQRVNQLAARPDFPVPLATLQMGRVWVAARVWRWARRNGYDA